MNDEGPLLAAIRASLRTNSQAVVQALIQEKVAEIAVKFSLSQATTERACQVLCSRHVETVNQTLAGLYSGESELQREFFTILQEQQPQ